MKCATIDRNLNGCRGNATNGKFCKIHSYMVEYTDEMVSAAKPCGTCRKTHYMGGIIFLDFLTKIYNSFIIKLKNKLDNKTNHTSISAPELVQLR